MKSYVVIGLGLFGGEIAKKLYELGQEVIAIDKEEEFINEVADSVTRAAVGDARDDVRAAYHLDRLTQLIPVI